MSSKDKPIREISAKWDDVLMVCRKCGKKVGGGFGKDGEQRLEKALKSQFKEDRGSGNGRYKVVGVSCLGICPKNAVCLVHGSAPGIVHLVKPDTPMDEVVEALAAPPPRPGKVRRVS